MRFSYSIRKNIFETAVGGLMNKLHLHKRRDTLIFADIFTNYIKACEDAGHREEIKEIAHKWMILYFNAFVPDILKKIPPLLLLNKIMKKIWANLGLLDDLIATKEGKKIIIKTRNERITKTIGKNDFLPALYMGVLNVLFNSQIKIINAFQTKDENQYNEYEFLIEKGNYPRFLNKEKTLYLKLNSLPTIEGFSLTDAFETGIFHLRENKIYFRDKYIYPVESTIFHLLGDKKLLFEKLPKISYEYFKEIMKESEDKEKLTLLKTLLQIMGWGVVTIISEKKEIRIEIKNPPYGLQTEKDNWDFLAQIILGYLWLIDKKLKIKNINSDKNLLIEYSI